MSSGLSMIRKVLADVYRRYPKKLLFLFVLTILVALVEGGGIAFLIPILEVIKEQGQFTPSNQLSKHVVTLLKAIGLSPTLLTLLLIGFIMYVLQALLRYANSVLISKTSYQYMTDLRITCFAGLLNAHLAFTEKKKIGSLANTIVTESLRASNCLVHVVKNLSAIGLAIVYLTAALFISWQMTFLVIFLFAIVIYLLQPRIRMANVRGTKVTEANDSVHSLALDILQGIRVIKIFGREGFENQRFSESASSVSGNLVMLAVNAARMTLALGIGVTTITFILVYVGTSYLHLSSVLMLTFLIILVRVQPMIRQLNQSRHRLAEYFPGYRAIHNLISTTEPKREQLNDGKLIFDTLTESIRFEDVCFSYDGRDDVLMDVNLEIGMGKTTAIVGSSGAGKSTIVDLITSLYDPNGRILVDGTDLRHLNLISWRSAVAMVSQDTFLFNDTVMNNIRYGNLNAADEEVIDAAKGAHANEFIVDLPQGYQTTVGDRGVLLSGGEKQRLALARAIVRNPQILILDEATSNLDSKSERLIQESLKEISRDRTVIVIAHRLSTIERADRIFVLEKGRIVEEGCHEELLSNNGSYAEYYNIQSAAKP